MREGNGGTNEVTILITIIVVFRISTKVVIAFRMIIVVVFGIVIIVGGNIVAAVNTPLGVVIFGVPFGCCIRLASVRGREML